MSEPGPQSQPDEAMVDLLIKHVTEGLSPAEQRALDGLDGAVASAYMREFERAAAAIVLAGSTHAQAPPADFLERLEQGARDYFATAPEHTQAGGNADAAAGSHPAAGTRATAGTTPNVVDLNSARTAAAPPSASTASSVTSTSLRSGTYGWFAAAACLVLALFAWERSPTLAPVAEVIIPPVAIVPPQPAPVVPPTPAEERAALMANSGALKITFGATKDPAAAGVTGDVVWDPATQRGYMHFTGLAANDPTVHQYQLWIFDAGRDKRYPVDGGVFDIPANAGDVVIPIHAALAVLKPAAFAVTIEKPGGVVVSGREHVVVLGAAG